MSEAIAGVSRVGQGMVNNQQIESGPAKIEQTEFTEFVANLGQEARPDSIRADSADIDTLANRILSSVEDMRSDYQRLIGESQRMLEPGPAESQLHKASEATITNEPTPHQIADPHLTAADEIREMLAIQLDFGRLMVHEQLVSSTAGRSNQSLDTLLRGQ